MNLLRKSVIIQKNTRNICTSIIKLKNEKSIEDTASIMKINVKSIDDDALSITKSNDKSTDDTPVFDMPNPFEKEKPLCILCKLNITPDYKNVKLLSQFQSQYTGRVYGKHITGLCEEKQKRVEKEINKAQDAGLMGYYLKDPHFLKDPKLFDSENPLRPHRF